MSIYRVTWYIFFYVASNGFLNKSNAIIGLSAFVRDHLFADHVLSVEWSNLSVETRIRFTPSR